MHLLHVPLFSALVLLGISIHSSSSAKIGIFVAPVSNSIVLYVIRLAEILTAGGHEVVIIRPKFNPNATKLVSKNPKIREIRLEPLESHEYFENFTAVEKTIIYGNDSFFDYISFGIVFNKMKNAACEGMVKNKEFLDGLRNENFDMAFTHHMSTCEIGIIHHLRISRWVRYMPGVPSKFFLDSCGEFAPSPLVHSFFHASEPHKTFLQRLRDLLVNSFSFVATIIDERNLNAIFRQNIDPNFPSIDSLKYTSSLCLINSNKYIDYPVGVSNKIIWTGGLEGEVEKRHLDQNLQEFVNNAQRLVFFSFGSVTIASEMPQEWKEVIIELFKSNPTIHFIWKFEEEIEIPQNVYIKKWIPQAEILALEKTVAFVTHGGYSSLMETISAGKPCLAVPLFADQYRNAELLQYRGLSITIEKNKLTQHGFLNEQLQRLLKDEEYEKAAKRLRDLVKNQPNSIAKDIVFGVDLVLKGTVPLGLPPYSFIELYSLDVIFLIGVTFLFLRIILSCYYWSCCKMAFKEKVKFE